MSAYSRYGGGSGEPSTFKEIAPPQCKFFLSGLPFVESNGNGTQVTSRARCSSAFTHACGWSVSNLSVHSLASHLA